MRKHGRKARQEGSCDETQQAALNSDTFVTIYDRIFPFLDLALAQVARLSCSVRVSPQILAKNCRFSPFWEISGHFWAFRSVPYWALSHVPSCWALKDKERTEQSCR